MADDFQPAAPFGAPVRRREDPRLITGRGRYVSDVELPRMLHVAFVRSIHAHARLRGVDTRAAAHAPGGEDGGDRRIEAKGSRTKAPDLPGIAGGARCFPALRVHRSSRDAGQALSHHAEGPALCTSDCRCRFPAEKTRGQEARKSHILLAVIAESKQLETARAESA